MALLFIYSTIMLSLLCWPRFLERMVNAESTARFFLTSLPLAASSRECIIIEHARRRQ